jgi:hypothetical protein
MVVWGGYDDLSAHDLRVAGDGAAYELSSNTWRALPPAPLSARANPIAVWTGREVLLLGGQPAVTTSAFRSDADGAEYDPALNRWTTIAPPVPPRGHGLDWVAAVQAGRQLLAWSDWSITRREGPGVFNEQGGVDLFAYDEQTGRWRLLPTEPQELPAVDTVLWTGRAVLVRGITYNCGSCPGPFEPEATDLFRAARNTWKRLPPDPLGSNDPLSAWTGAALVSFIAGGQFGSVGPGSAAAYDPQTNVWKRLPHAPFGCDSSEGPVWTGQALLMYCPRTGRGASGRHDGLMLSPASAGTPTAGNARPALVPRLVGLSAVSAYRRLHHAGLRVSIPHRFLIDQLASPLALVQQVTPRAGSRLTRGSIVTIHVGCTSCVLGSPGVPVGALPHYTIPSLVGKRVSAARRWIAHKTLYLTEHVGPLKAGNASSLFANYLITAQRPRPGRRLTLGIGTRNSSGGSGSFAPTPLTVWATQ